MILVVIGVCFVLVWKKNYQSSSSDFDIYRYKNFVSDIISFQMNINLKLFFIKTITLTSVMTLYLMLI